MAALQTIRSKGPLLIFGLGLALFAFIAGDYFKVFDIISNSNRQTIGELFGETYKYADYQKDIDDLTQVAKFRKMMQGQSPDLSTAEQDQIRQQAWENFKRQTALLKEAHKAGLDVTDQDVQLALQNGQAPSLQLLAQIFPNQQGGLDIATFQKFMKEFDANIANMRKQNQLDAIEQYEQIKKICEYSLVQLRQELLENKFYSLMAFSTISNKVNAKYEFDQQNTLSKVNVAAIPFSTIPDKDVKVTDEDLKKEYDNYKELFRNPMKSLDLQVLDVVVQPSAADRAALEQEVATIANRLKAGEDPGAVIGSSKSEVPYVNIGVSKAALQRMPDIAAVIDSLSVGNVKSAYYNAQDNTINTVKLVAKYPAADSVLYRMIGTSNEKTADSIANALKTGAKFNTLAQKYKQRGDSMWVTANQYEMQPMSNDDAQFFAELTTATPGVHIFKIKDTSIVVDILQRKNIETKYNLAIAKCPLKFSKETYNTALNNLNKFLSTNQTLESFTKNAGKSGFIVREVNNYSQDNLQAQNSIGGTGAKDAFRWAFDDAKEGQLSKLYECGTDNNHLLVIGVDKINDGKYLPWNHKNVKQFLTQKVLQNKKGEMLMAKLKNVKNINEAAQQKGAVSEELPSFTFSLTAPAQVGAIGVAEPKLSGAIAATKKGQFSGAIQGAGGVYFAQVVDRATSGNKFDAKTAEQAISGRLMQAIFTQTYYGPQEVLLYQLINKYGKETSYLYRF